MQNDLKRMYFMKEKNFGSKGKILFNGYPCKNVKKYFCIFFPFRTFCIFFILKTPILVTVGGFAPPPPPPVYGLVCNL